MNYEAPPEFADKIINIYIWFAVTPCVYLYLPGEFVFRELSFFILLPRSRLSDVRWRLLSSEKNCPAF